jgi:dynein heavy chain
MRGLRDFNIPKIVIDDQPIFKGLIEDLFPGIKAEVQTDFVLAEQVKKSTIERGLQADEGFVAKCVQLAEILVVRHCCFIIGTTGCSKSAVW